MTNTHRFVVLAILVAAGTLGILHMVGDLGHSPRILHELPSPGRNALQAFLWDVVWLLFLIGIGGVVGGLVYGLITLFPGGRALYFAPKPITEG